MKKSLYLRRNMAWNAETNQSYSTFWKIRTTKVLKHWEENLILKSSLPPKKLSTKTLAEEMKLVVLGENEFEYQDGSNLIAFSGIFGPSVSDASGKTMICQNLSTGLVLSIQTKMERTKSVVTQ